MLGHSFPTRRSSDLLNTLERVLLQQAHRLTLSLPFVVGVKADVTHLMRDRVV